MNYPHIHFRQISGMRDIFKIFSSDINDTIIFHDKFIDVWKDENYLKKYIFNGIRAKLELK